MNLSSLSIHMMLNITERWLADPELVGTLAQSGPLGIGILDRIKKAHGPLAELENKRVAAEATLRTLIDRAADLDAIHDRKARAVHHHLQGLIEGADEPELVSEYRALEALLFPIGLRVVQLPYIEEGGAAVALDRAVGPKHRAKLAEIHVGENTLLELLEAWLKAGHQLGSAVTDRAELRAELARERVDAGTLDLKAGRGLWIQAIRGLLWALEADEALAPLADRVHAALEEAAATSLRRRGEGGIDEADESDGGTGVVVDAPA